MRDPAVWDEILEKRGTTEFSVTSIKNTQEISNSEIMISIENM